MSAIYRRYRPVTINELILAAALLALCPTPFLLTLHTSGAKLGCQINLI